MPRAKNQVVKQVVSNNTEALFNIDDLKKEFIADIITDNYYWFHRFSTRSSFCYNFKPICNSFAKRKMWSETKSHNITLHPKYKSKVIYEANLRLAS